MRSINSLFSVYLFSVLTCMCAVPAGAQSDPGVPVALSLSPADSADRLETPAAPAQYVIGTDDVLSITIRQAPELNAIARVADNGAISLPLLGEMTVARQTTQQIKLAIEQRLRDRYILDPDVVVIVTEVRSQGVSVVGAVQRPGVIQVRGAMTLLDVLSLTGGLTNDAGDEIVVQRKTGAERVPPIRIKLKALLAADDSANVAVQAGDVINVLSAPVIYVMGAVNKPGAYSVRGNAGLTVLRALAYGEGVVASAARRDAVVLRTGGNGQRVEIPVDLDDILKGKRPDLLLEAQDVLFVPVSGGKAVSKATLDFLARVLTLRGFVP